MKKSENPSRSQDNAVKSINKGQDTRNASTLKTSVTFCHWFYSETSNLRVEILHDNSTQVEVKRTI